MRPTEGQLRRLIDPDLHLAEPGITLEQTLEPFQVSCRMLALAILAVDIGCGRISWSSPRPIIGGIAPPGLGASTARVQNRHGGIVGNDPWRRQHRAQDQRMQRLQPPASPADPVT